MKRTKIFIHPNAHQIFVVGDFIIWNRSAIRSGISKFIIEETFEVV